MSDSSHSSADLALLAAVTVLATVPLTTGVFADSPLRVLLGLPLLVVIPGYAILSVCVPSGGPFSGSQPRSAGEEPDPRPRWFSGLEWWALSIAISLLVVSAAAAVLIALPVAYGTASMGGLLALASGTALVIGALRRGRLPPDQGYNPGLREWKSRLSNAAETGTGVDVVLNLGLIVAVFLLLGSGVYAMTAVPQGPAHTELSLLTENESGEYVASGYPSTVEPGESIPIVLGVGNHEGQEMEYTLVVQEQRFEDGEVIERNRLRSIDVTVSDSATARDERNVTPIAEPGETVRITVLLYDGDVPETPTTDNAYRHAYFWTTISEPADDAGDDTTDSDAAADDDGGLFDFGDDDDEDDDDSEDTETEDDSSDGDGSDEGDGDGDDTDDGEDDGDDTGGDDDSDETDGGGESDDGGDSDDG